MVRSIIWTVSGLLLAMLIAPRFASARPGKGDEATMERAVDKALGLYAAKNYAEAARVIDEALAKHAAEALEDSSAWDLIAMKARYLKAICLREEGDLEGARRALIGLADQRLDDEVRGKAQNALAALAEKAVEVEIKCQPGITFRLYLDEQTKADDRGRWLACASATRALSRPPGSYVIEWKHGFNSQVRRVELALGRAHYFELMVPPPAPTAPKQPCGACERCNGS